MIILENNKITRVYVSSNTVLQSNTLTLLLDTLELQVNNLSLHTDRYVSFDVDLTNQDLGQGKYILKDGERVISSGIYVTELEKLKVKYYEG